MTHRERVVATINFQKTDRVPYALMHGEGSLQPKVIDYFEHHHGIKDANEILDFLDTDIRYVGLEYIGPEEYALTEENKNNKLTYSDDIFRPLADAKSILDIDKYIWHKPDWYKIPDFQYARKKWPNHAIIALTPWFGFTFFCEACSAFGMQEAMIKMIDEPDLFGAFIKRQHNNMMTILRNLIQEAKGYCDIIWLADDVAGNDNMLIDPKLWRKFIKPYLAEQVKCIRDNGMYVQFHSCGAIRSIIEDLIEIGVNILEVFQVTAKGMDVESIVRDFGGRIAFNGGIDCQNLMVFGTPEQVKAEVERNIKAFESCGGYIVANSHSIENMKGENLFAMCETLQDRNTAKGRPKTL